MDFQWVSVRLPWFFHTFKSVYSGCWNCHRGPEWCSNSRGIFQQAIFLITRAYGGFLSHGYPKSSRPSFWPWPSNLVLKAMVTSGSCHFKYITSFFSQRPAAFRFTGFDQHAVGKVRDCSSPHGLKRSAILAWNQDHKLFILGPHETSTCKPCKAGKV